MVVAVGGRADSFADGGLSDEGDVLSGEVGDEGVDKGFGGRGSIGANEDEEAVEVEVGIGKGGGREEVHGVVLLLSFVVVGEREERLT